MSKTWSCKTQGENGETWVNFRSLESPRFILFTKYLRLSRVQNLRQNHISETDIRVISPSDNIWKTNLLQDFAMYTKMGDNDKLIWICWIDLLVILTVVSCSSNMIFSNEWTPSSIAILSQMDCFELNVQTLTAVQCSTYCATDEEICIAFVYSSSHRECFVCKSFGTNGLKFNSVVSQESIAYKIGKLVNFDTNPLLKLSCKMRSVFCQYSILIVKY